MIRNYRLSHSVTPAAGNRASGIVPVLVFSNYPIVVKRVSFSMSIYDTVSFVYRVGTFAWLGFTSFGSTMCDPVANYTGAGFSNSKDSIFLYGNPFQAVVYDEFNVNFSAQNGFQMEWVVMCAGILATDQILVTANVIAEEVTLP